ncbi:MULTISPECIES: DUF6879 family protein [Streptomyces]|uniref:DUF6879 domain-containing protein n=1 Tax=Streptomyces doudnae TaxID=3075536 RepID=A0ABD5EU04_9ACTN|nr:MULTISPECIES: DUF6879 family protein [unclassified Streptomyces]MDT0438126.1 hypothetical protein [Streptomyces sp. DSM 41981]MYQ65126.1 hypothetical protein [Streptomyces sp. SID4950]SCD93174.1 hypothetical protein GA0115242_117327 [Streptomyces sp. SolWspMP-5a-2]
MARRLRFNGTTSDEDECPAVHEDMDTGEVIVQGSPLTSPDEVGQLQHLSDGEVAVVVPRELLVDWAPKDRTRRARVIGRDEFSALFGKFEHTAWRLETRRRYASDERGDRWRQFAETGVLDDDPQGSDWFRAIADRVAAGKRIERVRLVDDPPTVGQRYLLESAKRNIAAGEDIRSLWRAEAERLRLPAEDFWLFDSRIVALMHFDDEDRLKHVELITEPSEVVRCSRFRDAAWHHASERRDFLAELERAD